MLIILPLLGKDFLYPLTPFPLAKNSGSKCKILAANKANIDFSVRLLETGEIVAIPTETVYGLAGNALNKISASKIFNIKGRPLIDPLIVHFKNIESAGIHIKPNEYFYWLAEAFWPGPLTIVIPKKASIPDIVTAGLSSVAIRIPQHPIFREVLDRIDFPLAAPSANPFGYVSPTLAEHVKQTLGDRIEVILDGGPCKYGLESTIVDLRSPQSPVILRHGPITAAQIAEVLGTPLTAPVETGSENTAQSSPGRLTKHYSPHAKMILYDSEKFQEMHVDMHPLSKRIALVCSRKPTWYENQPNTFWLSEAGDLKEIAGNLFKLIQNLDRAGFEEIWVEKVTEKGLGMAGESLLQLSLVVDSNVLLFHRHDQYNGRSRDCFGSSN